MRSTWLEGPVPHGLPVRQVYGYLYTPDGRIFLQDDAGRFNLPGGRPEEGETLEQTLRRESLEESQVEIRDPHYVGYVLVEGDLERPPHRYAQVRLVCRLDHCHPPAPDPSTGKTYGRVLAPPSDVLRLLRWDGSEAQLDAVVRAARRHLDIESSQARSVEVLR